MLILGLGNELLRDDGLGLWAVRILKELVHDGGVTFAESWRGGLELLDLLEGHERAIIIDALIPGEEPGRIRRLTLDELEAPAEALTPHRAGLREVAALAERLGLDFPREVIIYTVDVADIQTVEEGLSGPVAEALPRLVELVRAELAAVAPRSL
ncbi:MAG: hydrogenase maturation protease [Candidatus Acetothermia bacterium]|jgi:hydrogenase maturation protease|nr:hydrogenase maturation protease [Candidatus Acetothermia bacterium]MDH7504925.1 hydrogenase maturation protease [Candidatus Acetothermia bacterium]